MRRRAAQALSAGMTLIWAQDAHAQGSSAAAVRGMGEELTRTGIWMVIAAILFALTYKVVDWVTPGDLKKQLAEGNTALAIFSGSLIIAAAIVIAAVLH